MNEGEIFKNFNGMIYSQKDITEYIDLSNVSDEKIAEVSGEVRTKLGINEIRKINKGIESHLEEGEKVEQIIKLLNVEYIDALTISSFFGGTMGTSMDYATNNIAYFTNKRIIMADTNVINQELRCRDYKLEDILGVVYTNQVVKVVKKENGELDIKIRRNRLKIFSIIYTLLFGVTSCLLYFKGGILLIDLWIVMLAPAIFFFQYALGKLIQDLIKKRIFFVTRDEIILQFVISSSNYKECDEYIKNLF